MKPDSPISWSLVETVLTSPHSISIIGGEATHDPALKLVAQLARWTDDADLIQALVGSLLPPAYEGNTLDEIPQMLTSALRKGFGSAVNDKPSSASYDPGPDGPVALGYNREGNFVFRDQSRNIIISASPSQLLSYQFLLGLAPSIFWSSRFPSERGFNTTKAGEALIAACRTKGPFNPLNIRGRGIWREGERVVVNLGDPIPAGSPYHYLCFEPIVFDKGENSFDTDQLLNFLRFFHWRRPQDAMLLLGWLAVAPVCGVLNWRPHCFVYGPPRCGKTTIHSLAAKLLHPLVISTDGQSSEAGIRQRLGPDSLPIIIDEFESDQYGSGIRSVLRLARSASSADNPVLRGTPEGRAMQFSLRTSFFFCAVNPGRMSPADQSRILLFELLDHGNNAAVAKQIFADEVFFRELGPKWCGRMVSLAAILQPAIDILLPALPSVDRRHCQNVSTLLAGAFVALHGRVPTAEEARALAVEYEATVLSHGEEIDRDNSGECLDHLLKYVVDGYPLFHWIALALSNSTDDDNRHNADRILQTYDIAIRAVGDEDAVLIKNGSPNIEKAFQRTIWEGRGWQTALRALNGAFSLKDPVWFSGSGKSRCIGIPASYIPPAIERPTSEGPAY